MQPARVIVLAGPSGAGKSRLAHRTGLPILRLDDFYKDADDPTLPLVKDGANAGMVDWDHPDSWSLAGALSVLEDLCRTGVVEAPTYDLSASSRTGSRLVRTGGSGTVVVEGIFAHHLVDPLRERGLLAAAYCITQHPLVTFTRRLQRDLRHHRKPPMVLVRRGLALMRDQRAIVREVESAGCVCRTGDRAYAEIVARHGSDPT